MASDKEYTVEELNYFRVCYITANVIRGGLQTLFKREWDRIYGGTHGVWEDTAKNGQDFYNLESKRSKSKNKRLLNIIQQGDTNEWDCACFFFVMLFSDSFGPLLSPTVAGYVDDLRAFRNEVFAHLFQASIEEADFQSSISLVTSAFTMVHLDMGELQRISNQTSFPTGELQKLREQIRALEEELQAKPKSFMFLPPKPTHEVSERKTEVDDITRRFEELKSCDEDAPIVTVYLSGNPGCGKSQVAREFGKKTYDEALARTHEDAYTFLMTLDAESENKMVESYYKFARHLGVTEYSLNGIMGAESKLKPKERISHLKTLVSSKVREYSSWLLIFDNVNDLTSMRDCWPDDGWGGRGQVLVTTQDSINVPSADPRCQHVSLSQGMQHKDAVCLLRSICQFSSDDEEELAVVRALDYQPLAIASAAVYVQYLHEGFGSTASKSFTWKNYLKKLEQGKRDLTEKVYERTSKSYTLSMTSAVMLALERLAKNQEGFEHMIEFLSLCASEPVGLDVIVSFVMNQTSDLDEDILSAQIARCSLLILLRPEDSTCTGHLVKVHQVVHDAFMRYLLHNFSKDNITALTLSCIETWQPFAEHNFLRFDLEFHVSSKMMAPHLKSLCNRLESSPNLITEQARDANRSNALKKAFLSFGDICRKQGNLLEAKTYFEFALRIANDVNDITDSESRNKNEDNISFVASTHNNLGIVHRELGQFNKAKDHHENALALFERLNPRNPTTMIADSLNKLGNVFFGLGQFASAKHYFCRSLEIREQLYGHEHSEVAASLNNLGSVHSVLGELDNAVHCFQRSLCLREQIFGKVHPDISDSLCNLGIVNGKLGFYDKAIFYHKECTEMREKLYFPDHLLISHSYNNLGFTYKDVGKLEEAKTCYERALRIREKTLDKDHPDMAGLFSNLGVLYMELGELQMSKDHLNRALQTRLKVLGRTHCKVGDCLLNLGLVHERSNEFDVAAGYFKQALEIFTDSYPSNHVLFRSAETGFKRVSVKQAELEIPDHRLDRPTDPCPSSSVGIMDLSTASSTNSDRKTAPANPRRRRKKCRIM